MRVGGCGTGIAGARDTGRRGGVGARIARCATVVSQGGRLMSSAARGGVGREGRQAGRDLLSITDRDRPFDASGNCAVPRAMSL
eukprot:11189468-Lingulodinium_polyedra.AAC.1